MTTHPIDAIAIGIRHRKDLGDVEGLAASIAEIGLLHPIVIDPQGRLIAGERRLAACKHLGWSEVPVSIVPLAELARGEAAENFQRKDFAPSEAVAIKRALEPVEREAARERMVELGRTHGNPGGKLPQGEPPLPGITPAPALSSASSLPLQKGKTRDKVASFTGMGARTLDKAEAIVEAAEREPERFGKLAADMDRTGRVDGPYKRLVVAQKAEAIRREPPPLPGRGPYRVIVADPPWPYELRKEDPSHRATHPYPQMSIAQICAMDVRSIAHDDCLLWLWTTNHHMREAFEVLDAWGFQHKTILTWAKDRMGTGDWLRGQTEHCLMAVRGKPVVHLTNQTTLLNGPLRANSQKPEEFYAFVEGLCPAPRYAELFSRTPRPNWDGHGDEADAA